MTRSNKQNERGSVAVAILAGLFVLAVGSSVFHFDEGEKAKATTNQRISSSYAIIAQIEANCMSYKQAFRRYPHNEEQLTTACMKFTSSDDQYENLRKGYLRDAWNAPLIFTFKGDALVVISSGPDKEINTDDDLTRKIKYE